MAPSRLSLSRKSLFPTVKSSFTALNREEIETHIAIAKYGSFRLTDAIRPSYDLRIVPEEGYTRHVWRGANKNVEVPLVAAMVSREKLSDLFFDLLSLMGGMVNVVLESSHSRRNGHIDYTRDEIDLPILKSRLYDFEDLLLNDGYFGIAVVDPTRRVEIRFDEHKIVSVFGSRVGDCESVFKHYHVPLRERLRFLCEEEHLHASAPEYRSRFEVLCTQLGIERDYC
ncbi:MAG: hypothetical protein ACOX6D_02280 [Thermoguttaceae bacterium]|jgi:hypothetical protein